MTLQSAIRNTLGVRLTLIVLPLAGLVRSQAVNPPWELQTFDFGWSPYNNTLTQCRTLLITWEPRSIAGAPAPTPPYYLVWWLAGYAPYRINMGAGTASGSNKGFTWVVNIPTGGPYINSMEDSAGGTGGVADVVNVLPATGSCQTAKLTQASLDFVVPAAQVQCSTLQLSVSGGTPPYILHVLPEAFAPKSVSYSTGVISYVLDVKAGINTYLAVEDSAGNGAVAPSFIVASGSDSSCLTAAPSLVPGSPLLSSVYPGGQPTSSVISTTSSSLSSSSASASAGAGNAGTTTHSSKTPMIAGIAAAAGALLLAVLAFLFWRRQRKNNRHIHATDFDRPHVDPLYGTVATNPPTSGYGMASGYHPNHGGPSMSEVGYGREATMNDTSSPSSNPRDSILSSPPSSAKALFEAQRNERKIDPTSASAYYTRPLLPNSTSSYSPDPTTYDQTTYDPTTYSSGSSAAMPPHMGGFTVVNQEPHAWDRQETALAGASRRVASPPLPPGAAMPNSIQGSRLSDPGFISRSNTTATALDRHKTPPPQYSPNH